ncbi:MAG: hypothetical protein WCG61_06440 [Chlorobium sp.]
MVEKIKTKAESTCSTLTVTPLVKKGKQKERQAIQLFLTEFMLWSSTPPVNISETPETPT